MMLVDQTLNVLQQGMDGASKRHSLLANNLANADTPNYKRKDVDFLSTLKDQVQMGTGRSSIELATTNPGHISGSSRSFSSSNLNIAQSQGQVRADGNNVNVDAEMAKVAENSVYYRTLAEVVTRKYKNIDRAIKGGER